MPFPRANEWHVIVRLTRSLRIPDCKHGRIFSCFERVHVFGEAVSQGEMVEQIIEEYSSEIDGGWCLMWRMVSKKEADKVVKRYSE